MPVQRQLKRSGQVTAQAIAFIAFYEKKMYDPESRALMIHCYPGNGLPSFVPATNQDLYFTVYLFENKSDRNLYAVNSLCMDKGDLNFDAITQPMIIEQWDKDGNHVASNEIGKVVFHRKALDTEVITHEAVHMACNFLRIQELLNLSPDGCDINEELLAYCIGITSRSLIKLMLSDVVGR